MIYRRRACPVTGIKDKHWKDAGNRRYEPIIGTDGKNPNYQFGDWEIGNYQLVRLSKNAPKELEAAMLEFDKNAINATSVGFKFNTEPVASEYTAVMAELESSIYPLKYGVVSYEKGYVNSMKAMKAAGYDKIVNEFKKQYGEWYSKNKK